MLIKLEWCYHRRVQNCVQFTVHVDHVHFTECVYNQSHRVYERSELKPTETYSTAALMCRCPTLPAEALPGQLRVTGWQTEGNQGSQGLRENVCSHDLNVASKFLVNITS